MKKLIIKWLLITALLSLLLTTVSIADEVYFYDPDNIKRVYSNSTNNDRIHVLNVGSALTLKYDHDEIIDSYLINQSDIDQTVAKTGIVDTKMVSCVRRQFNVAAKKAGTAIAHITHKNLFYGTLNYDEIFLINEEIEWTGKIKLKKDIIPNQQPVTTDTNNWVYCKSWSEYSSYLNLSPFKSGATIEAIGKIKNYAGNIWYAVKICHSDHPSYWVRGYIYSGNVEVVSSSDSQNYETETFNYWAPTIKVDNVKVISASSAEVRCTYSYSEDCKPVRESLYYGTSPDEASMKHWGTDDLTQSNANPRDCYWTLTNLQANTMYYFQFRFYTNVTGSKGTVDTFYTSTPILSFTTEAVTWSDTYSGWYEVTNSGGCALNSVAFGWKSPYSSSNKSLGLIPNGTKIYIDYATGSVSGQCGRTTYSGLSGYVAMGLLKASTPPTVTATFDANGGTLSNNSSVVNSGSSLGTLPTPTRTGYSFAGWFTAASGGTQISESTTISENTTFYAHWTDITKPVVTSVSVSNVSKSGYSVTATFSDNVGVTKVMFPSYIVGETTDEIIWHEGTISGNTASAWIQVSAHKNQVNCSYISEVRAYDAAGNVSDIDFQNGYGKQFVGVYIDTLAPAITYYQITNVTRDGYDIEVTATDPSGISDFWFGTWNDTIGIDAAKWKYLSDCTIISQTSTSKTVKVHIAISDFDNLADSNYYTNIYAKDGWFGNFTSTNECKQVSTYVDATAPTISYYQITNVTKDGYDIEVTATDPSGISNYWFGTWNDTIGIDAAKWKYLSDCTIISQTSTSKTVKVHIAISDFDNLVDSNYHTTIYAVDGFGNYTSTTDCKLVSAYVDATAPVISDVRVEKLTATGYTISCLVSDNGQINRVQFPTWTENNGQDDLDSSWGNSAFSSGSLGEDGRWYYTVDVNNGHNGEVDCTYITHIYSWDTCGNVNSFGVGVFVDATAPVITSCTTKNVTKDGYDFVCTFSDNNKVVRVRTDTFLHGQYDTTHRYQDAVIDGNTATIHVSVLDFDNRVNCYYRTVVTAFDECGNGSDNIADQSWADAFVDATAPIVTSVSVSDVSATGYTVTATATDNDSVTEFAFATWTNYNSRDDILWETIPAVNGSASYHVSIADHNYEFGRYGTDVYARDKCGNQSTSKSVFPTVSDTNATVNSTKVMGSTIYKGHLYVLYSASMKGWDGNIRSIFWNEAKSFCNDAGGHLVTITSAEENDIVHEMIDDCGYYVWLGATDENKQGTFSWVTGEKWDYSNWNNGQPDDWGSEGNGHSEDYVMMYPSGYWNDYPYHVLEGAAFAFVCEFDQVSIYELPSSLKRIDSEAFYATYATVIIIPKSVTTIAEDAFSNCKNLKYIINHSSVSITPMTGVQIIE